MVSKRSELKKDAIGVTMLVGLIVLIGVVGLVFTVATKDGTLIKNVVFCWMATVMFMVLLGTCLFKGEVLIPRSKMMVPFGVYVCLSVISMVLSRYRYASAQELINLLCCGMLLFVTVRAVTGERAFRIVAGMIAIVAALSCLYGILQHYGVDPVFGNEMPWGERERSFSTMGHPNFFATFLILGLPVLLSLFFWSEGGLVKGLLMVLVCGALLCLFYTESRGAWLGYLGALPVWFLFSLGSRRLRVILLGPVVGVVVAMLVLLLSETTQGYVVVWALPFWLTAILGLQLASGERKVRFAKKPAWGALLVAAVVLVSNVFVDRKEIGGRMESVFEAEKGSVRTRRILWAGTLNMFMAKPLFGWGTGTFGIYFPKFRDPATAGKIMPNTLHAHCEYLETGSETGVIGLGVLLWMLGAFLWESVRRVGHAREGLQKMAIVGLLAGCIAILLQASVSVTTRWVVGRFFLWLGIGLTIAAGGMRPLASKSGKGSKKKQNELRKRDGERFWRMRVKPIRSPAARVVFILLGVGVATAGGWWGSRVFKSAVLTRKGEGFQIAAETIGDNLNEGGLLKGLRKREMLREQAVWFYERAIELNSYNLFAYYKLAHCYNLQGRFRDSLRTYRRMAKLAPDGSDIHFNLGVVFANMRKWQESRKEYETALSMKVGPLSWLGLARAHENLRLFDRAEEQYEAMLKAYPNDVRGLNSLAGLYLRRGKNRKAMELYGKVLGIDPEDVDARLGAGLIYQAIGDDHKAGGDSERAMEYYRKSVAYLHVAVARRPDNVPIRAALALACAEVGRFDDALTQLQTASRIKRGHPLVHLNLGKVYVRMRQPEKAEEEFRRTREIDPTGPWGADAREQLRRMGLE